MHGRSHCTTCGHTLGPGELIPIVSYVIQRGRCRSCGEKISSRYWIVEAIGGVAACCCSHFYSYEQGTRVVLYGVVIFAYLAILMVVAMIDYDTRVIYDRFHLAILVLAIAAWALDGSHGVVDRLIGAVVIAGPMLLLTILIPGAFGGGDIKLMAAAGLFLGWRGIVFAMFVALLLGGGYGAFALVTRKMKKGDHFAFGPYLAVGLAMAPWFGDTLVNGYLSLITL